jgi:myo-inositol-1(or 4)-monophosphatase
MSSKPDLTELLELAKSIATRAAIRLLDQLPDDERRYVHCLDLPREIKSIADTVLEADILRGLAPARLPILSEESGHTAAQCKSDYWFIVDPLDGTFNFVKGLGPSAVSIALWNGQRPVFGVIFNLLERQLVWGGPEMGAYAGDRRISVSCTSRQGQASICTGLPVRFDVASDFAMWGFCDTIRDYAKVRMLGSAAISLLQVARGSADVYAEQNIMLWDVAAGLAIVEGAGGRSLLTETGREWCYGVIAANASLFPGVASRAQRCDRI